MSIDWSIVTVDHVRQACARYDDGSERPSHPARSTFLLWGTGTYPAKFIRGLAYRLATGRSLRSNEYTGGAETVSFFRNLSLKCQHTPSSLVVALTPPVSPTPSIGTVPKPTPKQALKLLLQARFGNMTCEARHDWLCVQPPHEMTGLIRTVHDAVRDMRGHTDFATAGFQPCCDYYVPDHKLIVEYDEFQHFTKARKRTLELYPADLMTHFDRQRWIEACDRIDAKDKTPIYRDEQRAFYDSVMDICAAQSGIKLIRMMDGDFDWTSAGAAAHLDEVLRNCGVVMKDTASQITEADREVTRKYLRMRKWTWDQLIGELLGHGDRRILNGVTKKLRTTDPWKWKYKIDQFTESDIDALIQFIRSEAAALGPPTEPAPPTWTPPEVSYTDDVLTRLRSEPAFEKIALVSHDYNVDDEHGLWDYSRHLRRINEVCDQQSCDTILYTLYTWDIRSKVPRTHDLLFDGLGSVRRIIVEVGDLTLHCDDPSYDELGVEVWLSGSPTPFVMRQRFASSEDRKDWRLPQRFMRELPYRRIGDALVMLCGESQIVSENRTGGFYDEFGFLQAPEFSTSKLILNLVHDVMNPVHGTDVRAKRKLYSESGHTVISVWNEGKGREAKVPWTVFHDGKDRTTDVAKLPSPVPERPDIRIGLLSVETLR